MKTRFWKIGFATSAVLLSVPATAATYLTTAEAQKLCFPQADRFESAHVFFKPEERTALEKATGQTVNARGQKVWKAFQKKEFLGYFIVDYVIGKHELIDYSVALTPEGEVKQLEVLVYRESYGWEVRDKKWQKQFLGKKASSPLELHKNISNIGGATLSCRHLTEGVKKVLAVYETFFKKI